MCAECASCGWWPGPGSAKAASQTSKGPGSLRLNLLPGGREDSELLWGALAGLVFAGLTNSTILTWSSWVTMIEALWRLCLCLRRERGPRAKTLSQV